MLQTTGGKTRQTIRQADRQSTIHTVRQTKRQTVRKTDTRLDRNRHGQPDIWPDRHYFFQSLSIPADEAKPILIKITKPCGRLAC